MNPSLLSTAIASLALLFTIISFWWIHARRGRIISYPIIVFSGYVNKDTLRLRLPIVIHNTGAKPTVVRGLALKYSDASGHTIEMPAEGFHTSVKPGATFEDFMHAYVIPGRTVVTKYVTFKQVGTIDLVPGQPVDFELEVLRDSNTEWKKSDINSHPHGAPTKFLHNDEQRPPTLAIRHRAESSEISAGTIQ